MITGGGEGQLYFNDELIASYGGGYNSGYNSGYIRYTATENGTYKIRAYASAGAKTGGNGAIKVISITLPHGEVISYNN